MFLFLSLSSSLSKNNEKISSGEDLKDHQYVHLRHFIIYMLKNVLIRKIYLEFLNQ